MQERGWGRKGGSAGKCKQTLVGAITQQDAPIGTHTNGKDDRDDDEDEEDDNKCGYDGEIKVMILIMLPFMKKKR